MFMNRLFESVQDNHGSKRILVVNFIRDCYLRLFAKDVYSTKKTVHLYYVRENTAPF